MRGIGAAGVALSWCLVAGCTGQDPPPSTATFTTTDATVSETSAATTAPTTSVPPGAPGLPDAARQQTPEGAEAFVRHWFDTLEYSWEVMDSAPIRQLGECLTCLAFADTIDSVRDRGNVLDGGDLTINSVDANQSPGISNSVLVALSAMEQREVSPSGTTISVIDPGTPGIQFLFDLEGGGPEWVVIAIREVA